MIALAVALGAVIGAPSRYLIDRAVQSRHERAFPFGTLTVNLLASLILGLVTGAAGHISAEWSAVIGTGFCGALSTYSTFSYETMRLGRDGLFRTSVGYLVTSVAAGLGVAALGWWIASSA